MKIKPGVRGTSPQAKNAEAGWEPPERARLRQRSGCRPPARRGVPATATRQPGRGDGRAHRRREGWRPRPYLWSVPKEPAAVGGPTPTDCLLVTQTVEVVVKGQLCP